MYARSGKKSGAMCELQQMGNGWRPQVAHTTDVRGGKSTG